MFFKSYTHWDWSPENPVTLTDIKNSRNHVNFPIDNDLYYDSKSTDLMPIITPAFPSMNATYNVS